MSNPTTPFSWQMPTNTDLVTDLPADFEVFGQAVATSMADLLGGTTGQILAKATNADMDFTWIANDQGDITGVTATTPLTGGGTSGAITVGIQDALTTQKGAVQLSDSTSTTSSILASTPTATKAAYDLAAAAVPKSTVTTAGDVIYATGSGAVTRLGIGTAGQVLTVNGGATAPSWATPAGGGGMTSIASGSLSTGTGTLSLTSIVGTYKDLQLVVRDWYPATNGAGMSFTCNSVTDYDYATIFAVTDNSTINSDTQIAAANVGLHYNSVKNVDGNNVFILNIYDYANTSSAKAFSSTIRYVNQSTSIGQVGVTNGSINTASALTSISWGISAGGGNFAQGTYVLYGVN